MTRPAALPRLISAVRGRIRLHLPDWFGAAERDVERRFGKLRGVHRARANGLTGNVLVHFDPARTDAQRLLAFAHGLAHALAPTRDEVKPANASRAGRAAASSRDTSEARAAIPAPGPRRRATIASPPAVRAHTASSRAGSLLGWVAQVIECAPCRKLLALVIGRSTVGWLLAACQLAQIVHALFYSQRHPLALVSTGVDAVRLASDVSYLLAA